MYFNSVDMENSVVAIKRIFDSLYCADLQETELENAKRFSWHKCVLKTIVFCEKYFR